MSHAAEDPDLATTTQTLDALIESERKLFDAYVARGSAADTRAAGVITAVFAVATVTVAISRSVSLTDPLVALAAVGYAFLVFAVGFALVRVGAGLRRDSDELKRRNFGRMLTVESRRAKNAVDQLAKFGLPPESGRVASEARTIDPVDARLWALELWRARTDDAHKVAIGYDRAAVPALLCLATGLACLAVLGLLLILGIGTGS